MTTDNSNTSGTPLRDATPDVTPDVTPDSLLVVSPDVTTSGSVEQLRQTTNEVKKKEIPVNKPVSLNKQQRNAIYKFISSSCIYSEP